MKERNLDIKEHLFSGEYTFKDDVFFVPGVLRGAIYDLNSSNVYSINQLSSCVGFLSVPRPNPQDLGCCSFPL